MNFSRNMQRENEIFPSKIDLRGADLEECNLLRSCLKGANLEGAVLIGANLIRAQLDGANLQRADLTNANLYGVSIKNTNLNLAIMPDGKRHIPKEN